MMPTPTSPQSRVRRTVNDLVMAEMFLVQATIESATVLSDGINTLGKQVVRSDDASLAYWESITGTLYRIADDALEPYTSRFQYFRDRVNSDG